MIIRPVTVIHKTVPTVLDGCLKVGGLLGFLKIFSSLINFLNKKAFEKELRRSVRGLQPEARNAQKEDDESFPLKKFKRDSSQPHYTIDNLKEQVNESLTAGSVATPHKENHS
jgi:hypothetical protein